MVRGPVRTGQQVATTLNLHRAGPVGIGVVPGTLRSSHRHRPGACPQALGGGAGERDIQAMSAERIASSTDIAIGVTHSRGTKTV
jgi:hypothetical protein